MSGDFLDVILVGVALAFAVSGYRRGFVVGVLAFIGFVGGGVVGAKLAPSIVNAFTNSASSRSSVALVIVFVAALLGDLIGTIAGTAVRNRINWRPARLVDSVAGAAVSILPVALVAWLAGTAAAHSPFRTVSREVQHSWVLRQIDDAMPISFNDFFAEFRRLVGETNFPPVFGGLGLEHIVDVPPPDPRVLHSPAVRRARPEVVKVVGLASCSRRIEGSGFLYAPNHVLTNAHVVAGVKSPTVTLDDGRRIVARVVLFDPRRDVAILYVPGFGGHPLVFAGHAHSGASAVVAGYPENASSLIVGAARVRDSISAQGQDIYYRGRVTRDIYSLRAIIRPGNSGGPLLAPDGSVYGVVFAAATDDNDTGYALTASEVEGDARSGAHATSAVGTQGCD
jgi:S1-C subfamily serine protease